MINGNTERFFLIEMELQDCHVKVNREFVVPAGIRLDKLHNVIQYIMGWRDCHMHLFHTSQGEFGLKDPDSDDDTESEKSVLLSDVVTPSEPTFYYEYDMGDGWEHILEVKSFDYTNSVPYPIHCLAAQGTCPPEDVGGTSGYENFCEIISNPKHPEYEETLEWVDCTPDEEVPWPDHVSVAEINEDLHRIKYKPLKSTKRSPKPRKKELDGKFIPYGDKAVFLENAILKPIMTLPQTEIYAALQKAAKEKADAGLTVPFESVFAGNVPKK